MKRTNSGAQIFVSESRFRLYPEQLALTVPLQDGSRYTLYMQKGKQVLGQINTEINAQSVCDNKATFDYVSNSFNFQIFHQRNMKCRWSLYTLKDDAQFFVESSQFDLKETWNSYVKNRQKNYFKDQIKFRKGQIILKFGVLIAPNQDFLNKFVDQMQNKHKKRPSEVMKMKSSSSKGSLTQQSKTVQTPESEIKQAITQEPQQMEQSGPKFEQQKQVDVQTPTQENKQEGQIQENKQEGQIREEQAQAPVESGQKQPEAIAETSQNKEMQEEQAIRVDVNQSEEPQRQEPANIQQQVKYTENNGQTPIMQAQQAAQIEITHQIQQKQQQQPAEEITEQRRVQAQNTEQVGQEQVKQPTEENENKEGMDKAVNEALSNVTHEKGSHIEKIRHEKVKPKVQKEAPQQMTMVQKPKNNKMKYIMIAIAFIIVIGVAMFGLNTSKVAAPKKTKPKKPKNE